MRGEKKKKSPGRIHPVKTTNRKYYVEKRGQKYFPLGEGSDTCAKRRRLWKFWGKGERYAERKLGWEPGCLKPTIVVCEEKGLRDNRQRGGEKGT